MAEPELTEPELTEPELDELTEALLLALPILLEPDTAPVEAVPNDEGDDCEYTADV